MKKIHWVFLFLFILAIDIAGVLLDNEVIVFIAKPLLIPVLILYFVSQVKKVKGLNKAIVGALLFSWFGDVLLLFDAQNPLFFLLGLSAFLIAHIFYIFYFHGIRVLEGIRGKVFLLLIVFAYYAFLMTMLSPWLGSLKLPVRIYGVFICFMLMLAMHMLYIKNKKAGWQLFIGALLFVISDSVLAINKFYFSFAAAGVIIMLTYGVAQLLITEGAIEYGAESGVNSKE